MTEFNEEIDYEPPLEVSEEERTELLSNGQQTCWSAKKCRGKVLSHRDRHNCKVKSHGKSWSDGNGNCYDL